MKPAPSTVSVSAAEPAGAVDGVIAARNGSAATVCHEGFVSALGLVVS